MGYYGRRYMRTRTPRQDNPELVERIEKTAAQGVSTLTDWERNFLNSLLDSAKKWGRLSAKQHDVYQRIEKKTDPAFQAARKTWNENYTQDMADQATFAANYYKANPPYFSDAAERILSDENFIPSEKLYRKMVQNKYVQRAMANTDAAPLYEVGSMVTVRFSMSVRGTAAAHRGKSALVLETQASVTSATKGARIYKILPVGAPYPIQTEERWLKKSRRS